MKTIATIRAEGYDVQVTSEDYQPREGSITNGQEADVDLGDLELIMAAEIINDTTGKDLLVALNGSNKYFTVKGDEEKVLDKYPITSIKIKNESGSTINYRILMWGF